MSKEIKLNSIKYPNLVTIVDEEDYNELIRYGWTPECTVGNNVYAVATINYKHIRMHRKILENHGINIKNKTIDHKDTDGLNNKKDNLRICSNNSQNLQNARKPKLTQRNPTSIYKGVNWRKDKKKWCAEIKINYKKKHLGYFVSEKDAARAYNNKALELFKEYANINDIV